MAAPHTFKQPLRLPWLDYALETAWPWGPGWAVCVCVCYSLGWAVKTKRPPLFLPYLNSFKHPHRFSEFIGPYESARTAFRSLPGPPRPMGVWEC